MIVRSATRVCVIVAALSGAHAARAAHFALYPIKVAGSAEVNATTINDGNVIAGSYRDTAGSAHGFMQSTTDLTILPPVPKQCGTPQPYAINSLNHIAGSVSCGSNTTLFVWRDGHYAPRYFQPFFQGYSLPTIGIDNKDNIFFTWNYKGIESTASYGRPPNLHQVGLGTVFNSITSLNRYGVAAGSSFGGANSFNFIYFGTPSSQQALFGPGVSNADEGYINDRGQVAGTFYDASGYKHGFLYWNGKYTQFDMPVQAKSLFLTGFNNSGRVVGFYLGTDALFHVFLYNGKIVSAIADYGQLDSVSVHINNLGVIVLSHTPFAAPFAQSYRVICSGSGC